MADRSRVRALLLLCVGIGVSAYAMLAMDAFMRTARSVLMMGSKLQPGGAATQSVVAVLFLVFLLTIGVVLILRSIRIIVASRTK